MGCIVSVALYCCRSDDIEHPLLVDNQIYDNSHNLVKISDIIETKKVDWLDYNTEYNKTLGRANALRKKIPSNHNHK